MPHGAIGPFEIPAIAGIAATAVLLLLARFWWLRQDQKRGDGAESADHDRLADLYLELRRYAAAHSGRLPVELPEVAGRNWSGFAYRPVPSADGDAKLIVVHDDAPRRRIVEFPSMRTGRLVLFWSGRARLVTESAFERLLAADDALRSRLGIDEPGGIAPVSNMERTAPSGDSRAAEDK